MIPVRDPKKTHVSNGRTSVGKFGPSTNAQDRTPSRAWGFGRHERIVKTGEFRKIYKEGRWFKVGDVVLYYLPNSRVNNRIGFSISSSRIKKAAGRNRIRRLFKEAYRKNKSRFKAGFDMVFVFKKDPGSRISYQIVERDLFRMMQRAGLGL